MSHRPLSIPDVIEITPKKHGDHRGFFAETYNRAQMLAAGLIGDWVQDNQSRSAQIHTLRGLHYQLEPHAQAKLVRVLRGRILDVVVDLRRQSPTYRQWVSLEVSAEKFNQIYVPVGFAHGFVTLEPDTEVFYKVSSPYAVTAERSVRWDDPELAIDWGIGDNPPVLSDKDRIAPLLADAEYAF